MINEARSFHGKPERQTSRSLTVCVARYSDMMRDVTLIKKSRSGLGLSEISSGNVMKFITELKMCFCVCLH